jgi:hypothetical protein
MAQSVSAHIDGVDADSTQHSTSAISNSDCSVGNPIGNVSGDISSNMHSGSVPVSSSLTVGETGSTFLRRGDVHHVLSPEFPTHYHESNPSNSVFNPSSDRLVCGISNSFGGTDDGDPTIPAIDSGVGSDGIGTIGSSRIVLGGLQLVDLSSSSAIINIGKPDGCGDASRSSDPTSEFDEIARGVGTTAPESESYRIHGGDDSPHRERVPVCAGAGERYGTSGDGCGGTDGPIGGSHRSSGENGSTAMIRKFRKLIPTLSPDAWNLTNALIYDFITVRYPIYRSECLKICGTHTDINIHGVNANTKLYVLVKNLMDGQKICVDFSLPNVNQISLMSFTIIFENGQTLVSSIQSNEVAVVAHNLAKSLNLTSCILIKNEKLGNYKLEITNPPIGYLQIMINYTFLVTQNSNVLAIDFPQMATHRGNSSLQLVWHLDSEFRMETNMPYTKHNIDSINNRLVFNYELPITQSFSSRTSFYVAVTLADVSRSPTLYISKDIGGLATVGTGIWTPITEMPNHHVNMVLALDCSASMDRKRMSDQLSIVRNYFLGLKTLYEKSECPWLLTWSFKILLFGSGIKYMHIFEDSDKWMSFAEIFYNFELFTTKINEIKSDLKGSDMILISNNLAEIDRDTYLIILSDADVSDHVSFIAGIRSNPKIKLIFCIGLHHEPTKYIVVRITDNSGNSFFVPSGDSTTIVRDITQRLIDRTIFRPYYLLNIRYFDEKFTEIPSLQIPSQKCSIRGDYVTIIGLIRSQNVGLIRHIQLYEGDILLGTFDITQKKEDPELFRSFVHRLINQYINPIPENIIVCLSQIFNVESRYTTLIAVSGLSFEDPTAPMLQDIDIESSSSTLNTEEPNIQSWLEYLKIIKSPHVIESDETKSDETKSDETKSDETKSEEPPEEPPSAEIIELISPDHICTKHVLAAPPPSLSRSIPKTVNICIINEADPTNKYTLIIEPKETEYERLVGIIKKHLKIPDERSIVFTLIHRNIKTSVVSSKKIRNKEDLVAFVTQFAAYSPKDIFCTVNT